MSRFTLGLVAVALIAVACVKADSKTVVKADASGTVALELSYKLEAIEQAKGRVEEMRARAEESGREGPDQAQVDAQLATFTGAFEVEKATAELKSRGFEVTKSEAFEKDGWKGVKLEGTFADVNKVLAADRTKREAQRAEAEAARAAAGEGGQGGQGGRGRGMGMRMGGGRGADTSAPFVTQFVTTDKPEIGEAILLAARQNRGGQGNAGGRQGRGGGQGGQGGGPGGMGQGMADMKRTMTITLPGKIVETVNCKKIDDYTVSLEVKGTDMQPDEDGNMPNIVTQGAKVRFEIPEGCKITFDAPKVQTPPAPAGGEAAPRKRGELRTDGGGGN